MTEPIPGRYRHFKGGEYEVLGIARHSETQELLVVYRPLYNETGLWVRPVSMFLETVEHDGRVIVNIPDESGSGGIDISVRPENVSVKLVNDKRSFVVHFSGEVKEEIQRVMKEGPQSPRSRQ